MAHIYLDCDMTQVVPHRVGPGIAVVVSRRSPNKQTPNEDAAAVIPLGDRHGVLVVADGLGGMRAGDTAARIAVRTLVETLQQITLDEPPPLRAAIINGIELANRRILELGVGAATTMAVLEINHATVRPCHVGDSMVLVTGGHGKIKCQTVAHSPVGFAVEAGLLDQDAALHHKDRHLVSNVVGTADMRIEIGPELKLAARDTAVLASDGLVDNLTVDQIVEIARKGPLPGAVSALVDQARQRMIEPRPGQPSKPDDITIIAYRGSPLTPGRAGV